MPSTDCEYYRDWANSPHWCICNWRTCTGRPCKDYQKKLEGIIKALDKGKCIECEDEL